MTEAEFSLWRVRGVPMWPRRLEMMLAQLCVVVAQCAGNKGVRLKDMDLFDPDAGQRAQLEEAAGAVSALSGIGTRKIGQGRKK